MKQTIKQVLMGILLVTSALAHAQPVPPPQLKPDRVAGLCGEFKAMRAFFLQPGSPYKELLAYADKEKTHRTYVLIDPSDGEVLHIVEYPEGKGCLVSTGFLTRVAERLFQGL